MLVPGDGISVDGTATHPIYHDANAPGDEILSIVSGVYDYRLFFFRIFIFFHARACPGCKLPFGNPSVTSLPPKALMMKCLIVLISSVNIKLILAPASPSLPARDFAVGLLTPSNDDPMMTPGERVLLQTKGYPPLHHHHHCLFSHPTSGRLPPIHAHRSPEIKSGFSVISKHALSVERTVTCERERALLPLLVNLSRTIVPYLPYYSLNNLCGILQRGT